MSVQGSTLQLRGQCPGCTHEGVCRKQQTFLCASQWLLCLGEGTDSSVSPPQRHGVHRDGTASSRLFRQTARGTRQFGQPPSLWRSLEFIGPPNTEGPPNLAAKEQSGFNRKCSLSVTHVYSSGRVVSAVLALKQNPDLLVNQSLIYLRAGSHFQAIALCFGEEFKKLFAG